MGDLLSPRPTPRKVLVDDGDDELRQNEQSDVQPGSRVRVVGLRVAVQLNNALGEVEAWDPMKGRWRVRLAAGETKAFLPQNLREELPSFPSVRRKQRNILEAPVGFSQ